MFETKRLLVLGKGGKDHNSPATRPDTKSPQLPQNIPHFYIEKDCAYILLQHPNILLTFTAFLPLSDFDMSAITGQTYEKGGVDTVENPTPLELSPTTDLGNLVYQNDEEEPELHMRTYVALFAMFILNYVLVIALNGPAAVVSKTDTMCEYCHSN